MKWILLTACLLSLDAALEYTGWLRFIAVGIFVSASGEYAKALVATCFLSR